MWTFPVCMKESSFYIEFEYTSFDLLESVGNLVHYFYFFHVVNQQIL